MNVLVCIKPDLLGQEIGPFETLAVEAALTLKDSGQASRVDVITAGPAQWREIIVRALGMGADQGCHIVTPENEGSMDGGESLVPASITADRLRRALCRRHVELPYDLILTGVMSQDWMAGQTGPMLAEYLGVALATSVVKIFAVSGGIRAVRQLEGGVLKPLSCPCRPWSPSRPGNTPPVSQPIQYAPGQVGPHLYPCPGT